MSKCLEIFLVGRQNLIKEFETKLAELNKIVKAIPDFIPPMPPWLVGQNTSISIVGNSSRARKGFLKQRILDFLSDNEESCKTLATICDHFKDDYQKGYIVNTIWRLENDEDPFNGFRVERIQPDGEKATYFKVKAK